MLGPLEMVIFIAILGGVIAGLLVLVLRGIPLLIKYLINPKVKKDSPINKEPSLLKIINKINFRSYGLKEWAFISIIVFVSFFFLEKIYTNFAKDIFYDASYSITNFMGNIPERYTEFKRQNKYNKLVSNTAKKLSISMQDVKRYKRFEDQIRSDISQKIDFVKNKQRTIKRSQNSLKDEYDSKLFKCKLGKSFSMLEFKSCSKKSTCKELGTLEGSLDCYLKQELDRSKQSLFPSPECKKEMSQKIEEGEKECRKKAFEVYASYNKSNKEVTEKFNCLINLDYKKIPNIFNYSNLEKYKNDFDNIPKC